MSKGELDYRITKLKCTFLFDYIEDEAFEEFYLKLRGLCDDYNVHVSSSMRMDDIKLYGEEQYD